MDEIRKFRIKTIKDYYEAKISIGTASSGEISELVIMLRHERLVHLIVLAISIAAFFICTYIAIARPGILMAVLLALVTIVTLCYVHYYYFLENTTQRFELELLRLSEKSPSTLDF